MAETESETSSLLPILLHAIPTVISYRRLDQILQANAEGARILARHSSFGVGGLAEKLDNDNGGRGSIFCDEGAAKEFRDDSRLLVTKNKEEKAEISASDDIAAEGGKEEETELFIKRVTASSYAHKSWTDLRRTLVYLRTEVRFYNEIAPLLLSESSSVLPKHRIPHCYHAAYDLDGLVEEGSATTDVYAPSPFSSLSDKTIDTEGSVLKNKVLQDKGGHILLQSLSPPHYFQDSPISLPQSLSCLEAVADMHASAWGNLSLLQTISDRLSSAGGSYHLKFRNPKELKGLVASWDTFRAHFLEYLAGKERVGKEERWMKLLEKESVVRLGQRVFDMAEYVSKELTPRFDAEYATLVHGDFKAMNVFLPTNDDDKKGAIMIDFSCAGIGYGMSDVAMHIVHAVLPEHLENGGEEKLVDGYLNALEMALNRKQSEVSTENKGEEDKQWAFPRDIAWRHYRLACIDYLRFIMGRFWRSATPETFKKKKNSRNTTLINRNIDSAMTFIEKSDRYLEAFEKEKELSGI